MMRTPKPHHHGKSPLKKYASVAGLSVLLTLAASNFLKTPPGPSGGQGGDGFLPSRVALQEDTDGIRQAPRWQLPEEWRRKIVAAVPMSTQGLPWVKAGRSWRRGLRTAFITDFYPSADMILDGGTHGETFVFINTTNIPYRYYGKAAMVPSMASEHFGDTTYEWLLYGDDDTVWFMDSVIDIVSKLDPNLPWMITDHLWFWRTGINSGPVHPAFDAPRCVPCHFNKTGLDIAALGFDPPLACPYCTRDLLCKADTKHELYNQDCSLNLKYPQDGEYLAHGGGGIILSVGLMRMLPVSYMQDCIQTKFQPDKVFGGDTLFSHCVLFTGVAPTDPGHFIWDQGFNGFDPGGQLIRSVLDLFYGYLKKGCCDGMCEARLRALTTLHLRGMHFKEPEAAMEYMRLLVDLRDLYLHVREKGVRQGGHTPLTPSWDNHKVCA